MQKIIGVTELQRNFREVFDEVSGEGTPYVLTRGSRPEVAMIPYNEFLRYQEQREQEVLAGFDRVWARLAERNAAFTEDEIAADIAEARAEIP